MKTYTIMTPEPNKKTGKAFWHDIGTLFADDDATGINGCTIKLHMHPGLKVKVYHRDRKDEHHSDTHEGNDVDTQPIEQVDGSDIPF